MMEKQYHNPFFPSILFSILKFLCLFQDSLPNYPFNHREGFSKIIKKSVEKRGFTKAPGRYMHKNVLGRRADNQCFSLLVIGSCRCIVIVCSISSMYWGLKAFFFFFKTKNFCNALNFTLLTPNIPENVDMLGNQIKFMKFSSFPVMEAVVLVQWFTNSFNISS